jgi:hypothetical protein
MIKLSFVGPQRTNIIFEIEDKKVKLFDKNWTNGIQIYPLDMEIVNALKKSKNFNMQLTAALILDANKGKELEQYLSCHTEEEMANMIKQDAYSQGLLNG